MADSDPIMDRLEDQITWYDRKSMSCQRIFKRIKIAEIIAAALIPFLAALGSKEFPWSPWLTRGLEGSWSPFSKDFFNFASTSKIGSLTAPHVSP